MKIIRLQILISMVVLLLTACSKDSENGNSDSQDLIIGQWLFISENDYFCGTDNVVGERLAEREIIDIYYSDGTWKSIDDGVQAISGTWEKSTNGRYSIYFGNDDVTQLITIEIEGNTMKYNPTGCFDSFGENIYVYSLYNRQ